MIPFLQLLLSSLFIGSNEAFTQKGIALQRSSKTTQQDNKCHVSDVNRDGQHGSTTGRGPDKRRQSLPRNKGYEPNAPRELRRHRSFDDTVRMPAVPHRSGQSDNLQRLRKVWPCRLPRTGVLPDVAILRRVHVRNHH